jgi:carboxymethylenebutenolidase
MQRASDFDPEVLLVFDQYVHGDIDRRAFLERVGKFAIGTATAAGLLAALNPRFAEAQQVAASDARLEARYVEYHSARGYGWARGYLVRKAGVPFLQRVTVSCCAATEFRELRLAAKGTTEASAID